MPDDTTATPIPQIKFPELDGSVEAMEAHERAVGDGLNLVYADTHRLKREVRGLRHDNEHTVDAINQLEETLGGKLDQLIKLHEAEVNAIQNVAARRWGVIEKLIDRAFTRTGAFIAACVAIAITGGAGWMQSLVGLAGIETFQAVESAIEADADPIDTGRSE